MHSPLQILIVKIALRCQPMSMVNAIDAGEAATGDFPRISLRRLGHSPKAGVAGSRLDGTRCGDRALPDHMIRGELTQAMGLLSDFSRDPGSIFQPDL
jgi:hypothetical protein